MSFNHVVVWLDHTEAHVIQFNQDAEQHEIIKTHSKHANRRASAGKSGMADPVEQLPYFTDIANALKHSLEILIVGPGLEKMAFVKHLLRHEHELAENIVSVETVDHPSDAQLLAFARKYFIKADLLR
ncbi:translational machinery protein [Collimonas sp.]|jgi:stalled ribosome rescue protein Dom34|uniref:translational machinery protein n=1 Tax=Collimonas sp. TaxID=1963772 RepID=UPI002C50173B|nr:translational machinery protein [Collimonas sp.]HWW06287.1 translational machinery protein [Collimonas sp.]